MTLTEEQITYLRTCNITIAMPCYGGMISEGTFTGMLRFVIDCNKIGMRFGCETLSNESLITRGRINLMAKFMSNSTATHLMFIDTDICFEPAHIFQLLLDKKDIIGGLYPKKSLPSDLVCNVDTGDVIDGKVEAENNLIPVSRLGTGFMLINRTVIEQMMVAYPQLKFKNNIGLGKELDEFMYAFFNTGITEDLEYLSEDYYFGDLWRKLGGKIYANLAIKLDHSGYFKFPADPTNLYASLGVDTTNGKITNQARIAARALSPIKNITI